VVKEQNPCPFSQQQMFLFDKGGERKCSNEKGHPILLCLFPQKILFKHQLSESSLILAF